VICSTLTSLLRAATVLVCRVDPPATANKAGAMPKVTIYTAALCPYCHMAKQILRAKAIQFEEIDVTGKAALRAEMRTKAGGRNTVPQIWIGDKHIGGCDDLLCLERAGKLDALLSAREQPHDGPL
jgi:glutaredoxin 3